MNAFPNTNGINREESKAIPRKRRRDNSDDDETGDVESREKVSCA